MKRMPFINGLAKALTISSLSLAGCATLSPPQIITKTETITVPVPVAVKCSVDPGADPLFPDSDQAIADAMSLPDLAKLYREGRALRIARLTEVEALLKGCTG